MLAILILAPTGFETLARVVASQAHYHHLYREINNIYLPSLL